MRKQTKKQLAEFNAEVIKILEFYGATKVDEFHYTMNSEKIGKLNIRLDSEVSKVYSICAEFEDISKAVNYFNVKSFNGKMHSHELVVEPCLTFIDSLLDEYNQINGIDSHAEYLSTVESKQEVASTIEETPAIETPEQQPNQVNTELSSLIQSILTEYKETNSFSSDKLDQLFELSEWADMSIMKSINDFLYLHSKNEYTRSIPYLQQALYKLNELTPDEEGETVITFTASKSLHGYGQSVWINDNRNKNGTMTYFNPKGSEQIIIPIHPNNYDLYWEAEKFIYSIMKEHGSDPDFWTILINKLHDKYISIPKETTQSKQPETPISKPKETITDSIPDAEMFADYAKITFEGNKVNIVFTNNTNKTTATFKYRRSWSNRKYIDTVFQRSKIKPSWEFRYGWEHIS